MKVLVTGGSGFVGEHLVTKLLKRNHEVIVGYRTKYLNDSFNSIRIDITSKDSIKKALQKIKPDVIFHLAAQSSVPNSWKYPAETVNTNTIGTINLVQMVGEVVPDSKIITVGSSEEYGLSAMHNEIINESVICNPQNPYASSKMLGCQIAFQFAKKENLKLIHLRPFNHFGPGQKKGFVVSDFASQIAEIEAGLIEPEINVGDLSSFRDFTDVRDIVEAYVLLIESDIESGIFNISSGIPIEIKSILNILISLSNKKIKIKKDEKKIRPSNIKKFAGDSSKLKIQTGWSQKYNLNESLEDTLNWWRSQVN
ncbi:GDP-mannose 4,6-dehydratase [Bacillus sp. NEB1478]|uniref:GDP-mannose 4,6-dehydratase n=1 Tax=Bacillus sp. NEB1478 TaxID=3073816 RepID=UPI002872D713|nr:GDP-mannose 4,6-dehydratase [Bacillus sp. NEB1478]WNB92509.1 GDP-mannose 4,6-dehydratase [Bacillus sp. NEB1478]